MHSITTDTSRLHYEAGAVLHAAGGRPPLAQRQQPHTTATASAGMRVAPPPPPPPPPAIGRWRMSLPSCDDMTVTTALATDASGDAAIDSSRDNSSSSYASRDSDPVTPPNCCNESDSDGDGDEGDDEHHQRQKRPDSSATPTHASLRGEGSVIAAAGADMSDVSGVVAADETSDATQWLSLSFMDEQLPLTPANARGAIGGIKPTTAATTGAIDCPAAVSVRKTRSVAGGARPSLLSLSVRSLWRHPSRGALGGGGRCVLRSNAASDRRRASACPADSIFVVSPSAAVLPDDAVLAAAGPLPLPRHARPLTPYSLPSTDHAQSPPKPTTKCLLDLSVYPRF